MMKTKIWQRGTMLLAALLAPWSAALAAPAGRVLAATGEVSALRAGVTVKLARDATVESGDTIRTGENSNAQLRFTDGSIVALRPDSQFVIEGYSFRAADPAAPQDRGVFSLIKGGLRTITGLIGKQDRNDYLMKTPTATVGIRGTHYALVLCQQNCRHADGSLSRDGLYGNVLEHSIVLKNAAQEREFGKDEVFYVADAQTPPEKLLAPPSFLRDRLDGQARTRQSGQSSSAGQQAHGDGQKQDGGSQQQAEAPAQAPTAPVAAPLASEPAPSPVLALANPALVTTEDRNAQGGLVDIPTTTGTDGTTPTPTPVNSKGDGVLLAAGASARALTAEFNTKTGGFNATNTFSDSTLTTDAQGILSFQSGSYSRGTASALESGVDGGAIAWGRWANGTMQFSGWGTQTLTADQGEHILYGVIPTTYPQQDAVRFDLVGATRPTEATNTASGNVWSVTSGSVVANFLSQTFTGKLGLGLSSTAGQSSYALTFSSTSLLPSATNGWNGSVTQTGGTQNACTTACSANGTLIFAGTNASHAGTTYQFGTNGSVYVQGVAAFKR